MNHYYYDVGWLLMTILGIIVVGRTGSYGGHLPRIKSILYYCVMFSIRRSLKEILEFKTY